MLSGVCRCQVAAKYGEVVARDVLNARNIIDTLLTGPLKEGVYKNYF